MRGPAPIAGVEGGTVTVEGAAIRYLDSEGDGPPTVLLHGGIVDEARLSWRHVLPALAEDRRVIAPDLPGYGESDPPARTPTPSYYRTVLGDLLDTLELDRVALVGLSMGGAIALATALDRPARVDRLVAIDSYGLGGDIPWPRLTTVGLRTPLPGLAMALVRRSDRLARASGRAVVAPGNYRPDLAADVGAAWTRPTAGRAFLATMRTEVGPDGRRTNFVEALSGLSVPTRFVHGERDPLIPAHRSVRAAVLTPEADCHILRNCGHWPPRERPDRLVELLSAFIPA